MILSVLVDQHSNMGTTLTALVDQHADMGITLTKVVAGVQELEKDSNA